MKIYVYEELYLLVAPDQDVYIINNENRAMYSLDPVDEIPAIRLLIQMARDWAEAQH